MFMEKQNQMNINISTRCGLNKPKELGEIWLIS